MSLSLVLVYMELSRKYFGLHKTLGKYITMFQYKIHTRNVPNKFFVPPNRSESMNIEYLQIACPDPILVISHLKYTQINPINTGLCREFLRGRGSNVKKGGIYH